jgi:hypothetical protein
MTPTLRREQSTPTSIQRRAAVRYICHTPSLIFDLYGRYVVTPHPLVDGHRPQTPSRSHVASPMASPMRGGGVGPGGTPSSVNRTLMRPEEPRTFTFDRVFDDRATQSQVFEYVQPLVDAAVEGYNATIFTYGYTVLHTSEELHVPSTSYLTLLARLCQPNWFGQDTHHVRH